MSNYDPKKFESSEANFNPKIESSLKIVLMLSGTQNPGRYEYPFRFVLPRVLPGTYNSPNGGYIRYSLKANVDIPMASDYVNEQFFNVQSIIDLNEMQGLPLVRILSQCNFILI